MLARGRSAQSVRPARGSLEQPDRAQLVAALLARVADLLLAVEVRD
jgi:hypothetical protein